MTAHFNEWDSDALTRKYRDSVAYVDDPGNNYSGLAYVHTVPAEEYVMIRYSRVLPTGINDHIFTMVIPTTSSPLGDYEGHAGTIHGLNMECKYFTTSNRILLGGRRPVKSFSWGLSTDNFFSNTQDSDISGGVYTGIRRSAAYLFGLTAESPVFKIFSKEVARIHDSIYILGSRVGFIDAEKQEVYVKSPAAAKLLCQHLGDAWKINCW